MNKVWLIIRKEWLEIRQQYMLWGGMLVVPLVFVIVGGAGYLPGAAAGGLVPGSVDVEGHALDIRPGWDAHAF